MGTIHLVQERTLPCPATAAWSVVADYDRDPEWRVGVATMAPSPAGLVRPGTTTAEDMRFAGRRYRNDGEVVEVTDDGTVRTFRWRTTKGADAEGSRAVRDHGDGTCTVSLELVVRPHGPERLMAPLLRRMLGRQLDGDADRLAGLLATPATRARSGPAGA